jgi:hypothetical protein
MIHVQPVRKALVAALALSALVHVLWTFWPVEVEDAEPEGPAMTATLTEMPPPPLPRAEPPPPTASTPQRQRPRRRAAVPAPSIATAPAEPASTDAVSSTPSAAAAAAAPSPAAASSPVASAGEASPALTTVVLPPRVDLRYKVFLGTQGFAIGDATYRFEHEDDRYRISTVGQARGLAALIVRGTGKVESRGRITPSGLQPYEFAVERGSAAKREVAFFDWDAGNVVLHDGATAPLEAPTFDPLTVMWQPYFSPPGRGDQTFGLATTRRVARYTLTLQAEETIAWRRGDVVTQRWHRRSDDGVSEAWFWLAPSMHYIPVKMRVARTARGTLEVLLESIRVPNGEAFGLPAEAIDDEGDAAVASEARTRTVDDITFGMPGSAMPALSAEDLRGQ